MKSVIIDGKELQFMRSDGTLAEGAIGCNEDADGNIIFYEITGLLRDSVEGVSKYARVLIRRVDPVVEVKKDGES